MTAPLDPEKTAERAKSTNCVDCVFASWKRTGAGRLHPSGDGTCTWRQTVALPRVGGTSWYRANPLEIVGGFINRHDRPSTPCLTFVPHGGHA